MTVTLINHLAVEMPATPLPDVKLDAVIDGILQEIAVQLAACAESGNSHAIDLRSLPLSTREMEDLGAALGRGEVNAFVTAAGNTEIWETAYRGVWWLRHFGDGDTIAYERIEITPCPDILASARDDMREAAARLQSELTDETFSEGDSNG